MTLSTRKQLQDTVLHMWDGFTDQSFYESTLAAVGDAAYASNSFTVSGAGSVTFTSVTLSDFTVSAFATLDAFGGELVGGSDSISFPNSTTIRATIDSVDHDWAVAALSTGVEYHVLITRTGSTLTLYLDNVSQGTKTASADVTFSDAFDGADGSFADVRIRKVATTAGLVSLLYNKGVPGFEPFLNLGGEVLNWQANRYSGSGPVADESGGGLSGTISGAASISGGLMRFTSSESEIKSPVSSNLDITSGGFTILVRAAIASGNRPTGGDDANLCMITESSTDGTYDKGLQMDPAGRISAYVFSGSIRLAQSSESYDDGVERTYIAWHDGTNLKLFVDGSEVASLAIGSSFNFSNPLFALGHHDGSPSNLNPLVFTASEARFYNRALSTSEITLVSGDSPIELPNVRDAVLAYLPSYDDASNGSTSLVDYSGNQTTGTISGGPTWNTTDTSEGGTRSIESTGAGSVSFDDSGLPLGDSERSIVTWVRVDDYSNDTQWFEYGTDATGQRFGIGVRNTDWMVVAINGAAVGTQNTPAAGTWAPVIVTYAGDGAAIDTVTFYIDGVAYSASTQSGTGSNVPGTVSGAGALLASIVSGNIEAAIDDVLVYDRVLSSAEIADFSQNRNIFEAAPVVTPGTWKIDTLLFS